jgi:hypothetical protein
MAGAQRRPHDLTSGARELNSHCVKTVRSCRVLPWPSIQAYTRDGAAIQSVRSAAHEKARMAARGAMANGVGSVQTGNSLSAQPARRLYARALWTGGVSLKEDSRKQVVAHLEELRALLVSRSNRTPSDDDSLLAHVDQLQSLVQREQVATDDVKGSASSLEQRLLAWEAEHPKLVALASRVARTLENAGL